MSSQRITSARRLGPQGTMAVCTTLYDNPFKSCCDISVWTKVGSAWLNDISVGQMLADMQAVLLHTPHLLLSNTNKIKINT